MCFTSIFAALLMAQTPTPKAPVAAPKTPAPVKKSPATGAKPVAPGMDRAVRPGLERAPAPRLDKPVAGKPAVVRTGVVKPKPVGSAVALTTDDEKTIYALGLSIHRSLASFNLSAAELEVVKRGITDAALKQPAVELNEWGPKLQGLSTARQALGAEKEKAVSVAYLAKAATELGALKTESGLIYREVSAGSGASPKASDTVKVHYRGTLIDGTEFDSSYKRNEPAQFGLGQVIPCWTEGVQKMKSGGKAKLVCPSALAYGDAGRPSIPGGATLLFDIELLEIVAAP